MDLLDLSSDIVTATRNGWTAKIAEIEDSIEPGRYIMVLNSLDDLPKTQSAGTESQTLALVESGGLEALALLEMVIVTHGKGAPRAKTLNIYFHPKFDLAGRNSFDKQFLEEFGDVVAGAIINAVSRAFGEPDPVNELKLYARTEQMLGFFRGLVSFIAQDGGIDGMNISTHGQWMVFSRA